jgi:nucleotide-binding universal stress UspA family protein
MYQRILVPLDGSSLAEQVLPYAANLAKTHHLEVQLLRVIEPLLSSSVPGQSIPLADIIGGRKLEAQDYLDGIKACLHTTKTPIECSVVEGNPAQLIVEHGEEEPGTIIAMSTHGRSGIGRWVLGSIADKVLHATASPLLLVRASEAPSPVQDVAITSLIVPLDGSPLAEQVLPHVSALAHAAGPSGRVKVVLVRVTPTVEEMTRYMTQQHIDSSSTVYYGPYEEFIKEEHAIAADYLHRTKSRLADTGLSVEEKLVKGHPATAIVELARSQPNNMIMITTHGRSGLGRWVLGSVADKVVRTSGGPVFLVRADSSID